MGYPVDQIIGDVQSSMLCNLCQQILANATECQRCKANFCHDCITSKSECPDCQERTSEDTLQQTQVANLEELNIKCRYYKRGCPVVTSLSEYDVHVSQCDFGEDQKLREDEEPLISGENSDNPEEAVAGEAGREERSFERDRSQEEEEFEVATAPEGNGDRDGENVPGYEKNDVGIDEEHVLEEKDARELPPKGDDEVHAQQDTSETAEEKLPEVVNGSYGEPHMLFKKPEEEVEQDDIQKSTNKVKEEVRIDVLETPPGKEEETLVQSDALEPPLEKREEVEMQNDGLETKTLPEKDVEEQEDERETPQEKVEEVIVQKDVLEIIPEKDAEAQVNNEVLRTHPVEEEDQAQNVFQTSPMEEVQSDAGREAYPGKEREEQLDLNEISPESEVECVIEAPSEDQVRDHSYVLETSSHAMEKEQVGNDALKEPPKMQPQIDGVETSSGEEAVQEKSNGLEMSPEEEVHDNVPEASSNELESDYIQDGVLKTSSGKEEVEVHLQPDVSIQVGLELKASGSDGNLEEPRPLREEIKQLQDRLTSFEEQTNQHISALDKKIECILEKLTELIDQVRQLSDSQQQHRTEEKAALDEIQQAQSQQSSLISKEIAEMSKINLLTVRYTDTIRSMYPVISEIRRHTQMSSRVEQAFLCVDTRNYFSGPLKSHKQRVMGLVKLVVSMEHQLQDGNHVLVMGSNGYDAAVMSLLVGDRGSVVAQETANADVKSLTNNLLKDKLDQLQSGVIKVIQQERGLVYTGEQPYDAILNRYWHPTGISRHQYGNLLKAGGVVVYYILDKGWFSFSKNEDGSIEETENELKV